MSVHIHISVIRIQSNLCEEFHIPTCLREYNIVTEMIMFQFHYRTSAYIPVLKQESIKHVNNFTNVFKKQQITSI